MCTYPVYINHLQYISSHSRDIDVRLFRCICTDVLIIFQKKKRERSESREWRGIKGHKRLSNNLASGIHFMRMCFECVCACLSLYLCVPVLGQPWLGMGRNWAETACTHPGICAAPCRHTLTQTRIKACTFIWWRGASTFLNMGYELLPWHHLAKCLIVTSWWQ